METLHPSDSEHILLHDALVPCDVDAVTLGLSIGVTCRAPPDASSLLRGFRPLAGASCHRDHGNGARRFHPGLPVFIGSLPLLTAAWYDLTHTHMQTHARACLTPPSSPFLVRLALCTHQHHAAACQASVMLMLDVSYFDTLVTSAHTHTRMHTQQAVLFLNDLALCLKVRRALFFATLTTVW